jgi:pimeloyl-ACP methyl ester carboxylesterase
MAWRNQPELVPLAGVHVETLGDGPRVVLVHGSGGNSGWPAQRLLAERYTLVMPTRSGYPPNPPLDRIDFEEQANDLLEMLAPGDHLVGHSYGGVVALLAAASAELSSLAVLEPPAFGVAAGHPAVDELVAELRPLWPTELEPEPFLREFVEKVGAGPYNAPSPLPPEIEASVRALMVERAPWEAEIPFATLAAAPFPKLVVSGAHNPAFDAICDVLEERLPAERAVLPGAGHSIPRAPGFNKRLEEFLG